MWKKLVYLKKLNQYKKNSLEFNFSIKILSISWSVSDLSVILITCKCNWSILKLIICLSFCQFMNLVFCQVRYWLFESKYLNIFILDQFRSWMLLFNYCQLLSLVKLENLLQFIWQPLIYEPSLTKFSNIIL